MTARLHELLPRAEHHEGDGGGGIKLAVELGAGTGVVGLATAKMCGADVILTDLPSVVEGSLTANIALNCTPESNSSSSSSRGSGDTARTLHHVQDRSHDATVYADDGNCGLKKHGETVQLARCTINAALMTHVGRGRCCALPLDWEEAEVGVARVVAATEGMCIDVILSAESVWLKELVEPFANAFALLMQRGRGDTTASSSSSSPFGLLCCRDRSSIDSRTFARPSDVVDALQIRGFTLTLLFKEESLEDPGRDLLFYQVRASSPS